MTATKSIGAVEASQYVIGDNEYRNIYITPLSARLQRHYSTVDDIITRSQNMELVKAKIRKVARTDSSVLLYGKTGSGKGMAAEAILPPANGVNSALYRKTAPLYLPA